MLSLEIIEEEEGECSSLFWSIPNDHDGEDSMILAGNLPVWHPFGHDCNQDVARRVFTPLNSTPDGQRPRHAGSIIIVDTEESEDDWEEGDEQPQTSVSIS